MKSRYHFIDTRVAVLLLLGIVGGLLLAYGGSTTGAQLSPTPSFHVDIGSSNEPTSTGNTYVEDPNEDFNGEDQIMTVPTPLTSCVSRTVTTSSNFPALVINAEFNDANPDTIVRGSGSWITDGIGEGVRVQVSGTASNDGIYLVDDAEALVLTLDSAETLTNEGPLNATFTRVGFALDSERRIVTDIIIKNAQEMFGADIRFNYDPALIQVFTSTLTPFKASEIFEGPGFSGQLVGLINLPIPPYDTSGSNTHRTVGVGTDVDGTNGAAFFSGTYQDEHLFERSSESGPTVDGGVNDILPERNAGHAPDGGVFVRVLWDLQDQAPAGVGPEDVYDVVLDLTTGGGSFLGPGDVRAGSEFVTLASESPSPQGTPEITRLGSADLFDGVVSVNKTSPDPCPPPEPLHDVAAKGISGLKITEGSKLKLFRSCLIAQKNPCTVTQNHHLKVVNDSDHTEDIRVMYSVAGWPEAETGCTVNGLPGPAEIPLNGDGTVETGVPPNASRQATVQVTFSCPADQAEAMVGITTIQLRLEAVHMRAGSNSQPDDDASNDFFIRSKIID